MAHKLCLAVIVYATGVLAAKTKLAPATYLCVFPRCFSSCMVFGAKNVCVDAVSSFLLTTQFVRVFFYSKLRVWNFCSHLIVNLFDRDGMRVLCVAFVQETLSRTCSQHVISEAKQGSNILFLFSRTNGHKYKTRV